MELTKEEKEARSRARTAKKYEELCKTPGFMNACDRVLKGRQSRKESADNLGWTFSKFVRYFEEYCRRVGADSDIERFGTNRCGGSVRGRHGVVFRGYDGYSDYVGGSQYIVE